MNIPLEYYKMRALEVTLIQIPQILPGRFEYQDAKQIR